MNDFEITKREVLVSVSIIAILLLIGAMISGKISESQMDRNEMYNKALKVEDADIFEYGMRTNIGNAFVYGDLIAIDPVGYPEIEGQYMYIEKIKERYTKHTRTVTKTVNGKKKTETETYWTWDYVSGEDKKSTTISFLGVEFDSDKIVMPSSYHIATRKESYHVRYKYNGVAAQHTGTIFTELKDETISDRSPFYANMTIEKTIERLESGVGLIIFWVFWVLLIVGCVIGFYYIDNNWLE